MVRLRPSKRPLRAIKRSFPALSTPLPSEESARKGPRLFWAHKVPTTKMLRVGSSGPKGILLPPHNAPLFSEQMRTYKGRNATHAATTHPRRRPKSLAPLARRPPQKGGTSTPDRPTPISPPLWMCKIRGGVPTVPRRPTQ